MLGMGEWLFAVSWGLFLLSATHTGALDGVCGLFCFFFTLRIPSTAGSISSGLTLAC